MSIHLQTAEDVIEFLMMIKGGDAGRGLSEGPQTGLVEAIRGDRTRKKKSTRKTKRGASASQKRYGRSFKRLSPKYKKKNGGWKKDGFKRCVRAAHAECRRKHR